MKKNEGIIRTEIIPIRGTASDVVGIDSATRFKNTVNDSRIVTPEINLDF